MAPKHRPIAGWLPLLTVLAVVPLAWFARPAQAENRKFIVFLADLPKERTGPLTEPLPNRSAVYDQYFDKFKNSETGGPRVDSHAEWWEEVSYGDVTVSGDVFGWVSLPWPSRPISGGFDGNTSFQGRGRIPHIDLNANGTYESGAGENFTNAFGRFRHNAGAGFTALDPAPPFAPGSGMVDAFGTPIWTPGERFLNVYPNYDSDGNAIYDAGIPEIAIDKNGNGQIDLDRRANSVAELIAANITFPPDNAPPVFVGFQNNTEWFDFNGDGQWGFYGRELWIDRDGNGDLGQAAMGTNGAAATLVEFIIQLNNPQTAQVEWWDINRNGNFDYPEPFEDYMVQYNAFASDYTPVGDQYIEDNFPGVNKNLLKTYNLQTNPNGRTGNGQYNPPDRWDNRNSVGNSNKLQEVLGPMQPQDEEDERSRRSGVATGSILSPTGEPLWWADFWSYYFGTEAPDWPFTIPYLRKLDPAQPNPPIEGRTTFAIPFRPNSGGPNGNGSKFRTQNWGQNMTGTNVHPLVSAAGEGMYDGPAEYRDLPSSIYHQAGDQDMGEVTSPVASAGFPVANPRWGVDEGGRPDVPMPDGFLEAAGPLAFNVHGDGGYDGGNQMTTEYLTWRTDGTSLADDGIDFDGDGIPDFITQYARDINLDGMIDLGETPGVRGEFGLHGRSFVHNYGVDANPSTPPNGGPEGEYPFNRQRMLEDVVEALDDSVDFDEFLGGPGNFGNVISGLVLFPAGQAMGMFSLPAPSFDLGIRTRDRQMPTAPGRDRYEPIFFFNGLGIGLNDDAGEGDSFAAQNFHTAFAAHEYGHSWEGYPDLYDYDVYRANFTGRIINNPIGAWCVMAGGGLVHPVPILKEDSGWLRPVDITRELIPAGETTIEFKAWEFNRDRTVRMYTNPLYESESFWLWRNNPGTIDLRGDVGVITKQSFDIRQPGWGLLIMHVDRAGNLEGLPPQQRLGSRFLYTIVEADGLHNLTNGENTGDNGDVWPGATGKTRWDRTTDPSNRWYDGQSSGLEITNIVTGANSSQVSIKWSPRELPTFDWIQPPGGVSVSGRYQLRYLAYDQFGGTRIEFFAVRSKQGQPPSYDEDVTPLGAATKFPGEEDSAFQADVSTLEDGTYTFYARLIPGIGADGRMENSWSKPRGFITNAGNGDLAVNAVDPSISKYERWQVTCIGATPGAETWRIEGSLSGVQSNQATTGVAYNSDADAFGRSALQFTIASGSLPFALGDRFLFLTTGLTPHSAAVLVDDGAVVMPEPPVAIARVENSVTSGLAPLTVTFRHDQSFDPRGAALTYSWNFGDGSAPFSTSDANAAVRHTYTVASTYTARLTVTNSFGLATIADVIMTVREAAAPTVRIVATPLTGAAPLQVEFDGTSTTDPNPDRQGLDFVWNFGDGSAPDTNPRVTHVYRDPGTYRATLTVTNRPYGRSDTKSVELRVVGPPADQPPFAVIDADKLFGKAPLKVKFDGSRSVDPEGGDLGYEWDFGDRSPLVTGLKTVEHSFTTVGTYNVKLLVRDASNQTHTATLAIVVTDDTAASNRSPVAKIKSSSVQGPAPFEVTFDAGESADPDGSALSYAWDFGDGSPQVAGVQVTHTYTQAREYSVVLVVADDRGATGAATMRINVTSPAGSDSGRVDTDIPEIPAACGTGCGPAGLMPMLLTLIGIGGLRRLKGRLIR